MFVGTLTIDVLVSDNTSNLMYLEMCFVYIYTYILDQKCPGLAIKYQSFFYTQQGPIQNTSQARFQRSFDIKYGLMFIVSWLVVLRINALAVFQPYRDLDAGDNKSLKFKWRGGESNPGLSTSCSASQELNHFATAVHSSKNTGNVNITISNNQCV